MDEINIMSIKNKIALVLVAGAGLATTSLAFGHGAMIDPPARQVSCIQQGPLTGICKEASNKSNDGGQSIYTWQELTGFVGGDHSAAEARKAIPGHLLCSGITKGSGFNMASDKWKTAVLKPDANGKVNMRYGYTQTHVKSFTEIYINKKSVDPTKKVIGWDDVELLGIFTAAENTSPTSGMKPSYTRYEDFNVEIPADRTGRAVIFSRWQRVDQGNEGFYGCSDVVITSRGSDIIPPTPEPDPIEDPAPVEWYEYAKFTTNQAPAIGDTVIFRLMGGTRGDDLVKISKPITASNVAGNWISELATQINRDHSNLVLIGQKSASGSIAFNPQQPRNNAIFLNETGRSAVLSVEGPANAPIAIVPANFEVKSTSDASAAYTLDGSQSSNALSYRWKVVSGQGTFWLQEQQGGIWVSSSKKPVVRALIPANTTGTAVYELTVTGKNGATHSNRVTVTVKDNNDGGSDEYPQWQQGKTYVSGDKVILNGVRYVAGYWNQSQPGSSDAWKLADPAQVVEWNTSMTYISGNNVSYKGKNYSAKQWTVGNQPDQYPNIWAVK
ncbi:hypothetical protein NG42_16755 [Winslowiella iniecta]|uniref:Chitin-binding type-3 domain-containing protein n=2 Tax=Winslowiella iniecta TaxID=1560201 RepID=A0A0L7TCY2_9GAMM|nr:hypothetical protein NG42_16755 [Winslowiella iniecta]KOC93222.1 hypothetical protein NG43_11555 [Winslowiella iniecta]